MTDILQMKGYLQIPCLTRRHLGTFYTASGKHVREINTPLKPQFHITGVCRGITIFFLFLFAEAVQHVLTIYVLSKNNKTVKIVLLNFSFFTTLKYEHVYEKSLHEVTYTTVLSFDTFSTHIFTTFTLSLLHLTINNKL